MSNLSNASQTSVAYWKATTIAAEIVFKAVLSGGKGGQNVNKVSIKVELYWTPHESSSLSEYQKAKILDKLASKLNAEGQLRVVCEEARGQLSNKTLALEKLYKLIAQCFVEPRLRRPSQPTRTSVAKRLTSKSLKKDVKANRRRPDIE